MNKIYSIKPKKIKLKPINYAITTNILETNINKTKEERLLNSQTIPKVKSFRNYIPYEEYNNFHYHNYDENLKFNNIIKIKILLKNTIIKNII